MLSDAARAATRTESDLAKAASRAESARGELERHRADAGDARASPSRLLYSYAEQVELGDDVVLEKGAPPCFHGFMDKSAAAAISTAKSIEVSEESTY